jgi:hypothetical protein
MRKRDDIQRPQAFLSPDDFHVMLAVLEGYIQYVRQLQQESTPYQALYTKVEIAVFAIDAGNPETLDLSHEELGFLWKALWNTAQYLTLPMQDADTLERYKSVASAQLARVQHLLLTALLQAKGGGLRTRLN